MPVRIVRLGSPRVPDEGVRLGTVRRPPRGVRKAEYAALDYFDIWYPELAPSADLVRWLFAAPITEARWARFAKAYRREMSEPAVNRTLQVLARLSHTADFSVGCYCEDEAHCHRSVLRELLAEHEAKLV